MPQLVGAAIVFWSLSLGRK